MRFTLKHHEIAHARLRQLEGRHQPFHRSNGICSDIDSTFGGFNEGDCGYSYCDRIFQRMLGKHDSWPIGSEGGDKWAGNIGRDRRAFAGFMADFIEHTYLTPFVTVSFGHDMDDSWYFASFPDEALNGTYAVHTSIEKLAKKHGWKIRWFGDSYYNPWKKK